MKTQKAVVQMDRGVQTDRCKVAVCEVFSQTDTKTPFSGSAARAKINTDVPASNIKMS